MALPPSRRLTLSTAVASEAHRNEIVTGTTNGTKLATTTTAHTILLRCFAMEPAAQRADVSLIQSGAEK